MRQRIRSRALIHPIPRVRPCSSFFETSRSISGFQASKRRSRTSLRAKSGESGSQTSRAALSAFSYASIGIVIRFLAGNAPCCPWDDAQALFRHVFLAVDTDPVGTVLDAL